MSRLMAGFPPDPKQQVTLANWRTPPFSKWAFHHVREILPSAEIANDPAEIMELPRAPLDAAQLQIEEFLGATDTDGLAILHRGKMVFEHYANGMSADTPHILMSVSKSMLGLLAGALAARGMLNVDRLVTEILPELEKTAYRGATLRQLLDMRAGIAFEEDYLATSGPIVAYRKATGWNPLQSGETASDLRAFYRELADSDGPHGGRFKYISPNTDLLGWVIERATGRRYAELMSELLWKPMGARSSAYISLDRLGAPRCAGGLCATLADLARVGQLMLDGGRRDGAEVLPAGWIDDIARNGDPAAWAAGNLVEVFPGLPMSYRSKWYAVKEETPLRQDASLLFGWGIHGQHLFVDRKNRLVIAKVSSQALPIDAGRMALTLRELGRLRSFFSSRA